MTEPSALASVAICTRDRGDSVVATIDSVLANTYRHFEVILIDQSPGPETEQAVARFQADPRFKYIHSPTHGAGRAHNIGLLQAQGEIVLSTDDDCVVPPDWIAAMTAIFDRFPQVAVAFCNVEPAPHDPTAGFIPAYVRADSQLVQTMWDKCRARGIGAGMAVRRSAVLTFGGFDDNMGPGSRFRGCNDGDLAVRALLHDWWVYETHETAVVHFGFRTWHQGKALTERAWFGIGAAYAKPLKCGYWRVALVALYEALVVGWLHPLSLILKLRRPQGLKRSLHFCRGFLAGLKTPVDPRRIVYML